MSDQTYRGVRIHHHARGRWYWWRGEDDAVPADTLQEAKRQIDAQLGPITVRPVVAGGNGAATGRVEG